METMLGYLNAKDFGACGSSFATTGHVLAGSNRITVQDTGDFEVGQEINMSGCFPRCECFRIFGPKPYHAQHRKVENEVEIRGWNASNGNHVVYIMDVDIKTPTLFRWSDDQGRTWHDDVPIDGIWHKLSGGLEVRFNPEHDWTQGWVVTVVMRASLIAQIMAIEGNTLVLNKEATRSCEDRIIHSDTLALQKAIDAAVEQGKNLWIPSGTYRLSKSLHVNNARSLTICGDNPEETILDIGVGGIALEDREGACIVLNKGDEINLYNLGFRGAVGFDRRDQAGHMQTRGATGVWGFYFMKCNALGIWSTRRVYVENCHARQMSAECFYSCSAHRTPDNEPDNYTTSITYMRCSVENCARNAFNNNDFAENTHIIDCRIRNVGGCTWEGASRFVIMRGCYVRNAGPVALGNVRSRSNDFERLGTGQHMIVDNTFESGCPYGIVMIGVSAAASQVIIRGNNFINFNFNAISVSGETGPNDLPSRNVIISDNCFDMTAEEAPSIPRIAIGITASDVTVANNQIYVTGAPDDNLTAIQLRDDAQGIIIHDNLIRGCGKNIDTQRCIGEVGSVIDDQHFYREQTKSWHGNPPTLRRRSHRYRGWHIHWQNGERSILEDFDPETEIFTLASSRKMTAGELFELHPYTQDGNVLEERIIHDNLIC